jgi:excisionase family DNA binding protein
MVEASITAVGPERLLNVKDVAVILGVSVRTVRRMIADGTLPALHIRRSVRIHHDTVARLIDGNKIT